MPLPETKFPFLMKSDPHLLHIFRSFPSELYKMLHLPDPGPCQVQSVAVKQISRTADGIFTPLDPLYELLVTEFQMWPDEIIYDRIVITAACIRMENRPRKIRPVIVFGTASLDEKTEPWCKVVDVIYLDDAIKKLAESNPNHFLVALFRPLLEPDEKVVEKFAAQDYVQLQQVTATHSPIAIAPDAIFLDWLVQRFKNHTAHQIAKMIAQLTPIEQTATGRELINIGLEQGLEQGPTQGIEQGVVQGLEQGLEIAALKFLKRKFGPIPDATEKAVVDLGRAELEDIVDAIFDIQSLEDFQVWLGARRP